MGVVTRKQVLGVTALSPLRLREYAGNRAKTPKLNNLGNQTPHSPRAVLPTSVPFHRSRVIRRPMKSTVSAACLPDPPPLNWSTVIVRKWRIKRHRPEDIVTKLRQGEVLGGQGMARIDAIRQISITKQTSYRWHKQ